MPASRTRDKKSRLLDSFWISSDESGSSAHLDYVSRSNSFLAHVTAGFLSTSAEGFCPKGGPLFFFPVVTLCLVDSLSQTDSSCAKQVAVI